MLLYLHGVLICFADAVDKALNQFLTFTALQISDCFIDNAPHSIKTQNNHYLNTSEKLLKQENILKTDLLYHISATDISKD